MSARLRRELSAIVGARQGAILLMVYVYGLGSSLLIGAALGQRAMALHLATFAWSGACIPLVLGAGESLAQFAESARELRLPDHRSVLLRHYALILIFLVIVPILLFRIFIPDAWRLVWITLAMPLGLFFRNLHSRFVLARHRVHARS